MSFLFGKRKGKGEELAELRAKQIQQFRLFNPSHRDLNLLESAFEVSVATRFGNLIVHVTLDEKFPQTPPEFKVANPVAHQWCDGEGRISGHKDLRRWTAHMSMGRICQEIRTEFARNPPVPKVANNPAPVAVNRQQQQPSSHQQQQQQQQHPPSSSSSVHPTNINTNPISSSPSSSSPAVEAKRPKREPELTLPPVPDHFTRLDGLTIADLSDLVDNQDALQSFVGGLSQVSSLHALRDDLAKAVDAVIQENLAKKPALEAKQARNASLQAAVTQQLAELHALQETKRTCVAQFSLEAVEALYQQRMRESDQKSDELLYSYKRELDESSDDSSSSDSSDSGVSP
jgi:ubiquitin-protein ligase